jgi:hypothetical protein
LNEKVVFFIFLLYYFEKYIFQKEKLMTGQLLIVVMAALGIGLAVNPATSGINPGLFKGATWLFRGIVFRLLK